MALARLVAAVIDKLTLTNWGAPQTTNLGVSGSNPFGRAGAEEPVGGEERLEFGEWDRARSRACASGAT